MWQFTAGAFVVGYFFCRVTGITACLFTLGILIEPSQASGTNTFAAAKRTNVTFTAYCFGINVQFSQCAFDTFVFTFVVLMKTNWAFRTNTFGLAKCAGIARITFRTAVFGRPSNWTIDATAVSSFPTKVRRI